MIFVIGKIIISNNFGNIIYSQKEKIIKGIAIFSIIQLFVILVFYIFIQRRVLTPFKNMKKFATRVSDGNLDIPLEMDKNNNFGAFTEAFDIMRYEIKKARSAEKKAIEDKKELVAKLSHDIKTPIASIKSSSELGMAISSDIKVNRYFESINQKSDQINTLITNLFNATLEELDELKINPIKTSSLVIHELINNADYLHKGKKEDFEKCEVYVDKLRLQQVFDNVFANSYKYANTKIEIEEESDNDFLIVSIRDFGTSVKDEELPLLTEKFKRGSNINDKDGVGLGLYISKELMRKMNGELEIENAKPGFKVKIYLRKI